MSGPSARAAGHAPVDGPGPVPGAGASSANGATLGNGEVPVLPAGPSGPWPAASEGASVVAAGPMPSGNPAVPAAPPKAGRSRSAAGAAPLPEAGSGWPAPASKPLPLPAGSPPKAAAAPAPQPFMSWPAPKSAGAATGSCGPEAYADAACPFDRPDGAASNAGSWAAPPNPRTAPGVFAAATAWRRGAGRSHDGMASSPTISSLTRRSPDVHSPRATGTSVAGMPAGTDGYSPDGGSPYAAAS